MQARRVIPRDNGVDNLGWDRAVCRRPDVKRPDDVILISQWCRRLISQSGLPKIMSTRGAKCAL